MVELAIGQWKRHFHFVHVELRMQPPKACQIIAACAVLHNIAKNRGLPHFEEVQDCPPQPDDPAENHTTGGELT